MFQTKLMLAVFMLLKAFFTCIMLRMHLKCILQYSLSLFPVLFNGGKFIFIGTAGMPKNFIIIITNLMSKLFYCTVSSKQLSRKKLSRVCSHIHQHPCNFGITIFHNSQKSNSARLESSKITTLLKNC